MLSVLLSIKDFFIALVSMLWSFIQGIFNLLSMIPNAMTMLMYSVGYMPAVVTAFAVGLITISVVYLVIGR